MGYQKGMDNWIQEVNEEEADEISGNTSGHPMGPEDVRDPQSGIDWSGFPMRARYLYLRVVWCTRKKKVGFTFGS